MLVLWLEQRQVNKITLSLVSTVTVGAGGAASIDFTGIPQTGTDLLLTVAVRGADTDGWVRINSDSGTNYSTRELRGNGTSAASASLTSQTAMSLRNAVNPTTWTANTFSNATLYIPNYTGSLAKSGSVDFVTENNATAANMGIIANLWTGTAAITSLSLYMTGLNWVQYSTASLYTITKGSGGATVA